MKTVKEWLQELPDGYRERALGQMLDADRVVDSINYALVYGLNWLQSNEGFAFWNEMYNHYLSGTSLPPLPEEPKPQYYAVQPVEPPTIIQPGFPTSRSTSETIAIMQQWKEGDEWECREWGGETWIELATPLWNWLYFDYRKKPEPKTMKVKKWAHLIDYSDGSRVFLTTDNRDIEHLLSGKLIARKEIEIEFTIGEGL